MAKSSTLNPFADDWSPFHIYHPHHKPHYFNPPVPVFEIPAAAGAPPPHYFYHNYIIQSPPSRCADKIIAPPPVAAGRRRESCWRKVNLPPRLWAAAKTKIWRKKVKSEGISAADGGDSSSPVSAKTAVMIRHIPNHYQRDSFMAFLDKYCLQSNLAYDFLYLPIDFKTHNNVGYAFVNFTTAFGAEKIGERLHNFRWGGLRTPSGFSTSKKICAVTWARIQGKKELVKHFQKSNFVCSSIDYLPAVFCPPRVGSPDSSEPQPIGNMMGNVRTPPRKA